MGCGHAKEAAKTEDAAEKERALKKVKEKWAEKVAKKKKEQKKPAKVVGAKGDKDLHQKPLIDKQRSDLRLARQRTVTEAHVLAMTKPGEHKAEWAIQQAKTSKDGKIDCPNCAGSGKVDVDLGRVHEDGFIERADVAGRDFDWVDMIEDDAPVLNRVVTINKHVEECVEKWKKEDADAKAVHGAMKGKTTETCVFCDGSGRQNVWMASVVAPEVEDDDDPEFPCEVCYGPSQFGLSTECTHFYCGECITGSLEAIMDKGEFPAYCPMCKATAVTSDTKTQGGKKEITIQAGVIDKHALSFLAHRKIITTEFYYRFVLLQRRGENKNTFFACPRQCGNFIVEETAQYQDVLDLNKKDASVVRWKGGFKRVKKFGKCSCGCRICLPCEAEATPVYSKAVKDRPFPVLCGQRVRVPDNSTVDGALRDAEIVADAGNGMWFVAWTDAKRGEDGKEAEEAAPAPVSICDIHTQSGGFEHNCIVHDTKSSREADRAMEDLIKSGRFKRCPNCGVPIEKNEGCDYMTCGTSAHGKLSDALRNGGCGYQFKWSTCTAAKTSFNYDMKVQ